MDEPFLFTTDYLLDTYSFEELVGAGPLPHMSQPVAPMECSPRMIAPPAPSAAPVGSFTIRHLAKGIVPTRDPMLKRGLVMELGAPLDPNRSTRIPAFFQVTRMLNRAPKAPPKRALVLGAPVK